MSEANLTSYEDVPYESNPLYPTHPDCLATVGTLLGMRPAPVPRCRVLEMGCATGGNLIPMAVSLPESRFTGIDLSPRQIDMGQTVVQALGLTNIELKALSIMDLDDSYGPFDYIICHGVYSWVPPPVQDKILDICKRNLAPNGIAYVSYNTYPGWHNRAAVREMLGFHVQQFTEPQVRVQQARAFLDFLVRATPDVEGTYARVLKEEADLLRPQADSYLFHEHLEEVNHPLYFYQFMERATAKGLQYLGEAWFHTTLGNLPAEVQETLQQLSTDLIRLEQYLDFLRNRTFRRTLLCHDDVKPQREPSVELLQGFHATALARPTTPTLDLTPGAVAVFQADAGRTVSTNMPAVKAALLCLFQAWPRAVSFDELRAGVKAHLASVPGTAEDAAGHEGELLVKVLLQCYLSGLVALHVHPPRFVLEPGARPVAWPLARLQAATGVAITNLRHRLTDVSAFDRVVLPYLDGSRDRAALLAALAALAERGVLTIEGADAAAVREVLDTELTASLRRLAGSALLVAQMLPLAVSRTPLPSPLYSGERGRG